MRGTGSRMQGQRGAEAQAVPVQPQEFGRASQKGGVRRASGMVGLEVTAALPDSLAQRYLEAIPKAGNPMRKALLHERVAECLLDAGKLDEALRHALEAHNSFKGACLCDGQANLGEAQKFVDRFRRVLRSKYGGAVSVEFFGP